MTMSPAEVLEAAMDGRLDLDSGAIRDDDATKAPDQGPTLPTVIPETTNDAATADTGAASAAGAEGELERDGAPIASKSGAYTIPFQKLADARTERDTWKAKAEALEAQVQTLSTQAQANLAQAQGDALARAASGEAPTKADNVVAAVETAIAAGADASLFGDFSEEALAKGIQKLVDQQVDARVSKALEPMQAKQQQEAGQSHYDAIYKAHPDASEVAESAEFAAWRDALPSFMRAGVNDALKSGTTDQVIEVFTTFKASASKAAPQQTQAKQPEVERRVPTSLSEMAGAAPVDETQQVLQQAETNPGALLDRMSSMSRSQIDALMDRV